ncbi:hypothetical protein [uncultured Helicobacter sp.]
MNFRFTKSKHRIWICNPAKQNFIRILEFRQALMRFYKVVDSESALDSV